MNWDDLRFVLALSEAGSLARAAKALAVDHTTVGRRVEAAEASLGVRLFTRTTTGYVATADAERLLGPMKQVEDAVLAVERGATASRDTLEGVVRVTSILARDRARRRTAMTDAEALRDAVARELRHGNEAFASASALRGLGNPRSNLRSKARYSTKRLRTRPNPAATTSQARAPDLTPRFAPPGPNQPPLGSHRDDRCRSYRLPGHRARTDT
jgi:hypothetical protein